MENKETNNLLREIVALLSIQVKRGISQRDLILELNQAGLAPKRIAELLGTTSNTVSVSLNQLKKKK